MRAGDTIAALATAPGHAPVALIRLSGPDALDALDAACARPVPRRRGAQRVEIALARDDPPQLDPPPPDPHDLHPPSPSAHARALACPAVALLFPAPRSYTGEDCAELALPGSPHLVRRVLASLLRAPGVRPAEPGEFTARAYLNGRMSLDQAEGVALLVAAASQSQRLAGAELLSGRAGARTAAWADDLTTLLALVESGIDFTDQDDVVPIAPPALAERLAAIRAGIESERGGADSLASEGRHALPRVVLAGEPNAGKSTLFNALLGRARAVVSPAAGSTRDELVEPLDLAPGLSVEFADLPGLDPSLEAPQPAHSRRPSAADAARARARDGLRRADVVLWCDPRGAAPPPWVLAASGGDAPPRATMLVRTKADLPGREPGGGWIAVCALDGFGLDALRARIAEAARALPSTRAGARTHAVPRHAEASRRAARALAAAERAIDPADRSLATPELVADHLRAALDALGDITGRTTTDDVLARIFAAFCIGK